MIPPPPRSTLFPYPTLFRSDRRSQDPPNPAVVSPCTTRKPRWRWHGRTWSTARVPRRPPSHCRRSEEHTSELQSPCNLVCRLLLEKKKHYHALVLERVRTLD